MHADITAYLNAVCLKHNETRRSYASKLHRLADFVPGGIAHLTPQRLEEFLRDLQARTEHFRGKRLAPGPLSPFTIRSVCVTVKQFCRWLHTTGRLTTNPAEHWRIPGQPEVKPKAIQQLTFVTLLNAARAGKWPERDTALLYLLRDTGGRVGGLANAKMEDLDKEKLRLMVTEKGDRERMLHFGDETYEALRQWLAVRAGGLSLFHNRFGKPLTRNGIYQILRRHAERAGCIRRGERFNPHAFRHAFARDLLDNGADLATVAQLMGHRGIVVTEMYYARWNVAELSRKHKQFGVSLPMPEPPTKG